jgi:Lon-like protease
MTAGENDQPRFHQQRRLMGWWPFAALILALLSIPVAVVTKIPYYAISPGAAVSVEQLVHVKNGPSFDPKGEILLTTVGLKRTTIVEALQGWLDPTIDVVRERAIVPPDVGANKLREFNLQLMDTSKQQALAVAFQELGYDVVHGKGARVVDVVKDTPAVPILHKGDVIEAVDGAPTNLDADAVRVLRGHKPGDTVRLTIRAVGAAAPHDQTVQLTTNPDRPKRGFLGVRLETHQPTFDFPFEVDLESERIGGPSAGLAFTLEVLDIITEGELTGGRTVAATGTIELDGRVGEVGGVAQKTVAVREAGADIFLVPTGELKQARKIAGGHLRVEPVRNLHDALRILASLGGNGLALDRPGDT